ncbi:MAG TPA: hypothetical protein H9830_05160 [Candidatus Agrococcus pullicola]|uniref:Uncharacterized protein n=1 Tax=Candidatus Agrococcus pullicola TaxID=2838429 RepID=A0A9D1YTP5_9MICO|nr:hypothetical protein [Candidatus Agrococcus pullicola]
MSKRNRRVQRNQLQMWLGFLGFFAAIAVLSVVGSLVMGYPLEPLGVIVMIGLIVGFVLLLRRYRSLD